MYSGRFLFLKVLLALVATAALVGFFARVGFSDPVRVQTREVPAPLLSATSSVADVVSRFEGKPSQTVPGTELGLQGGTCDVYLVADAVVLVCHA